VKVVGELQRKRTLAASRGFLAAARLSCYSWCYIDPVCDCACVCLPMVSCVCDFVYGPICL